MNLIAAVDKNWGIGRENKLLVSIPEDMRFFREMTTGHVIVMGRKTLESFPGKRPLKDRVNIVLSRDPAYTVKGAVVVHNKEELQKELAVYDPRGVYVIGGESVYRLLLEDCDTAYLTRIDYAYDADAHFPDLDSDPDWEMAEESEEQTYFDLEYRFTRYERRKG